MKDKIITIFKNIPVLTRLLIPLATLVIISFLFPNHQRFNYSFEIGQQWKNPDLYAPFDFAILKEQSEIDKQLDSLKETLIPCYSRNAEIATKKLDILTNRFNEKIAENAEETTYQDVAKQAEKYLNKGKEILKKTYQVGIISKNQQFGSATPDNQIYIAKGKERISHRVDDFYLLSEAKKIFEDELLTSGLKEADFFISLINDEPSLIASNIIFSDSITNEFHESTIKNFAKGRGIVKEGERIISKREFINESTFQKLLSLEDGYEKKHLESNNIIWTRIGYFILSGTVLFIFLIFLRKHAPKITRSHKQLSFMFMWIIAFVYLVSWIESTDLISIYIVPFCIVPIVVRNFYDDITALFTHIVVVLMTSLVASIGFEFIFTQLMIGVIVVITNVKTRYWSRFFISVFDILLTYVIVFIGISILHQGTWKLDNWQQIGWILGSVFLTLLSYPLVPLLERIFGYTSDITLDELGHLDQPLLKQLSINAPGTLQHSLQVANLSEAAASAINANALLVKVAALYHDIGKTENPMAFIENQHGGYNIHDNLSPKDSAALIIGHVTNAVKKAKKHGLPKIITDFMVTHHGTTRVEYFYKKHIKDNPDVEVEEAEFRYPGPKPTTKEHVILMLADSTEAAAKSLKMPTEIAINELVERIADGKLAQKQFIHSDITFAELEKIKAVFKRLLKSIYHVRIEYPEEPKRLFSENESEN
jgi:putative nucleotidyltransferase with HDIG domain